MVRSASIVESVLHIGINSNSNISFTEDNTLSMIQFHNT